MNLGKYHAGLTESDFLSMFKCESHFSPPSATRAQWPQSRHSRNCPLAGQDYG